MTPATRPLRSVLYVPANKARAVQKARVLPADAVILDLEDAVAPEAKMAARAALAEAVATLGSRFTTIRVNGTDTDWSVDDLAACAEVRPDAVVIPKVDGPDDVARVAASLPGDMPLWAMIETPRGVLHAARIADTPRTCGLILGTNDLARALGCRDRADRMPLWAAFGTCLLAARAAGIPCVDGVFNAFSNAEGLRTECKQGRDLGFDGKTLIHPAQIDIANAVFAPDAAEIDLARRRIAALDAALTDGQGVAVLDGRIVETLHADMARATLARADAISRMES